MRPSRAIFCLFLSFIALHAQATDLTVERRWADALREAPARGEAVWLDAAGQRVFSLYIESPRRKRFGGVILLPDRSAHPDWPAVIGPLRQRLPDAGWSTLAVQMPVADVIDGTDAEMRLFDEAPARITAAIAFFKAKGANNIVLLGHGLGATMGAAFLASEAGKAAGIITFVGVGMAGQQYPDPRLDPANALEQIAIPVLDIYGERDLNEVKAGAAERLLAAQKAGSNFDIAAAGGRTAKVRQLAARKTGNPGFRQEEVAGADHSFSGAADTLVKHVRGWLKNYQREPATTGPN